MRQPCGIEQPVPVLRLDLRLGNSCLEGPLRRSLVRLVDHVLGQRGDVIGALAGNTSERLGVRGGHRHARLPSPLRRVAEPDGLLLVDPGECRPDRRRRIDDARVVVEVDRSSPALDVAIGQRIDVVAGTVRSRRGTPRVHPKELLRIEAESPEHTLQFLDPWILRGLAGRRRSDVVLVIELRVLRALPELPARPTGIGRHVSLTFPRCSASQASRGSRSRCSIRR